MENRIDITSLEEPEQQEWVDLISSNISEDMIKEHVRRFFELHEPPLFYEWHLQKMQEMEKKIGKKLPVYDGLKKIPKVFMTYNESVIQNIPESEDPSQGIPSRDRRNPTNPNRVRAPPIPIEWTLPAVCNADLDEESDTVGLSILGFHADFHNERGGILVGSGSPSAPIFYCFHVFLTDLYQDWKSCKRRT
jgi:hypothetical protein